MFVCELRELPRPRLSSSSSFSSSSQSSNPFIVCVALADTDFGPDRSQNTYPKPYSIRVLLVSVSPLKLSTFLVTDHNRSFFELKNLNHLDSIEQVFCGKSFLVASTGFCPKLGGSYQASSRGCPDDVPRKAAWPNTESLQHSRRGLENVLCWLQVTVLLYCNHGWSPKVGGELRAWGPFDQGSSRLELKQKRASPCLEQAMARRRPSSRFQGAWWFSCQRMFPFRPFCLGLRALPKGGILQARDGRRSSLISLEHRTGQGQGLRA